MLIGLTKTTLKKVLGRTFISLIALQTIVVEIEAILNDRPITYTSTDLNLYVHHTSSMEGLRHYHIRK